MHIAAAWGQHEVVGVLVESGANREAASVKGGTPLYAAAWSGQVGVVQMLLAAGADLEAANHNGYTPCMLQLVQVRLD
jgi:ankyrin repeat protein